MSDDLIKRDDALNACVLREDNPPTEMQLSLRNVISALPAVDLSERIEQLEAKLIIAVAYIRRHIPDSIYEQRQQARAVLAKLEGQ